jgi:hypothetical protein
MKSVLSKLAAASAIAVAGLGAAQASIIGITASGGSEALLNVVNTTDSSSVSLDLGTQYAGVAGTSFFSLPQSITDFINGAGGLSGVSFSVIAGSATNGTSAATYLHSTENASITNLANGIRGTWFTNFNNLVANRLNASNPGDTDTSVNNAYGPFASGVNGNYPTNGTDDWGTASSCVANANICNLVAGTGQARLFTIAFGTTPTGFATISDLAVTASLNLANARLDITPAVPLPAGIWLASTAFGLVGLRARRRAQS